MKTLTFALILSCMAAAPLMQAAPTAAKNPFIGTMQIVSVRKPGPNVPGLSVILETKREGEPKIKDKDPGDLRFVWARATVRNASKSPITGTLRVSFDDDRAEMAHILIRVRNLQPGKSTTLEEESVDAMANVKAIRMASWEWQPE